MSIALDHPVRMNLDRPVRVSGEITFSYDEEEPRPSLALEENARAIVELGSDYGIFDILVFGSSIDGTDDADSDINLLAKVKDSSGHLEIGAFVGRVAEMTGYPVDFTIDDGNRPSYIDRLAKVPL